jgi:hypothetical protein
MDAEQAMCIIGYACQSSDREVQKLQIIKTSHGRSREYIDVKENMLSILGLIP